MFPAVGTAYVSMARGRERQHDVSKKTWAVLGYSKHNLFVK